MEWDAADGPRRHVGLVVSVGLVLLIGALGLVAGHAAGQQARDVHRADRLDLQRTLAGLVEQYALLSAAEVLDRIEVGEPWSPVPGDPGTAGRLQELVAGNRALDAGAVLVSATGRPLASWSASGVQPAQDDRGWRPLRSAVASGDGSLPLSGVLEAGDQRLLAMGLPVPMSDGSRGLLIGLWDARRGGLQQYVAGLRYGQSGHGYVVDAAGRVLAGPSPQVVGELLPMPEVRRAVLRGGSGIVDTADDEGRQLVTSYADAGGTGWTAITPQDKAEFEGALLRSGRLVQAAVVALLLIAATALVVLHRKREAALETVAMRDDLTGLYNRRGWFALAEHELERARRQGTSRLLLFVDVDGLKQVNDALGHREGDRAIADAAALLSAQARSSDVVGRLGGDEFVLLLAEDGEAAGVQRRLVRALAAHNARSTAPFELRLSIGAERWLPHDTCSLDELLTRADGRMYSNKTSRPRRHEGVLRLPVQRSSETDVPTG